MEPTTSEWITAFQELGKHPELSQLVVHRHGDWSFVAMAKPKYNGSKGKGLAHTYYKTKLYNTVTYFW
jgi:hypothetical protein